jgi:hypothetical protein
MTAANRTNFKVRETLIVRVVWRVIGHLFKPVGNNGGFDPPPPLVAMM